MAVTFDTLKAATRLREEAGFSKRQATTLVATFADGILESLATKADVAALRSDMEQMEVGLRSDMEKMETRLRGDMGKNEASLLGEMHKLRHQMTVRFGAGIGAAVAIIVALDKLI